MVRTVVILLVSLFLITFLRMVIGLVTKGVAQLFEPDEPPKPAAAQANLGGELKKDPTCGTYVSTASPFQKKMRGQTYHYCSAACRDKHNA